MVFLKVCARDNVLRALMPQGSMSALMATRRSMLTRPVLVATAEGRPLCLSLGWTEQAPYATAVIEP